MGAKKMDIQKMGAAHRFFFWDAHLYYFILWAPRPSCAHQIFFFEVLITLKNNHGQLAKKLEQKTKFV